MSCAFDGQGLVIEGLKFLTPEEALAFLEDDAILVDLRDEIWKNGRTFDVKHLISLPYKSLQTEFNTLPQDRLLILADYVGIYSKESIRFLRDKGYFSVASLIGGIVEWVNDGIPTKINHDEELVGGCACQLKPRNQVKS